MNPGLPWWLRIAAILLIVRGAWSWWHDRPLAEAPGVLVAAEPRQVDVEAAAAIAHGRWSLTPRAHYDITARVLGRERYYFDRLASLVPVDLALGWGPMSDNRILNRLSVEQSVRFYWVHWGPEPPLPPKEILRHSANLHAIPADRRTAGELEGLRTGEVVRLTGELVDARRDDGTTLNTSLTREDTGAGACEVMLVERLERVAVQRP